MGSSWSSTRDAYARNFVVGTLSSMRVGRVNVLIQLPEQDQAEKKMLFGQRGADVDPELEATLVVKHPGVWWRLCAGGRWVTGRKPAGAAAGLCDDVGVR